MKGDSILRSRMAIQNLSDWNLSRECPGELGRIDWGKNGGKVPIESSQFVMVGLGIGSVGRHKIIHGNTPPRVSYNLVWPHKIFKDIKENVEPPGIP